MLKLNVNDIAYLALQTECLSGYLCVQCICVEFAHLLANVCMLQFLDGPDLQLL